MYYPSSENKGADQLRSNCEADQRLCFRICYCEADQRLCFRICRLLVFLCGGSIVVRQKKEKDKEIMHIPLFHPQFHLVF